MHERPLTFRNSYPLVLLPASKPTCLLPLSPPACSRLGWQSHILVLFGVGTLACAFFSPWLMLVWVAITLGAWGLLSWSERRKLHRRDQDDQRQVSMLLPAGDARQGRFDCLLGDLVEQRLSGLRACRRGPHLERVCGLNRFPDLVLVTASGLLVAIEIDEPWHWDGSRRVLSHEASVDQGKTQALLAKGLVVVRLAEKQVAEQSDACVHLLQAVVHLLHASGRPDLRSFYQQLPWPCDRLPLYRDANRLSWPRPQVRGYVPRPVKRQGRSPNPQQDS